MTPAAFIKKWKASKHKERQAYQSHFRDLCNLVGHPLPTDVDSEGDTFCFEKKIAIIKKGNRKGFVDVWKNKFFAIEYKSKGKDLGAAYDQLLLYREALNNPPLLITCDINEIHIHTNFTNYPTDVHVIKLEEMDQPQNLKLLKDLFNKPNSFQPSEDVQSVTQKAATKVGSLARKLISRGHDEEAVSRFITRIVFCMFAEDIDLLPENSFTKVVESSLKKPDVFVPRVSKLFQRMAKGGDLGYTEIPYFNGKLFDEDEAALSLEEEEIQELYTLAQLQWADMDVTIFGNIYETFLKENENKKSVGVHYTSRDDILKVIEPVILDHLQESWKPIKKAGDIKAAKDFLLNRLAKIKILDPACGSGNFLYVSLRQLKNIEKEVGKFLLKHEGTDDYLTGKMVTPTQFHGIEIFASSCNLARLTLWIGYLQWRYQNGFPIDERPVLPKMDHIENRDAILDLSDPQNPKPATWPEVDYIVSNPPFCGNGRKLRSSLGNDRVDMLYKIYKDRLSNRADLVCYWFDQGAEFLKINPDTRIGLIATQGVRGSANRGVLDKINKIGGIFYAIADQDWALDGAAVHVSIVCFDRGPSIYNSNLTRGMDLTKSKNLKSNQKLSFKGFEKSGPFDISKELAETILAEGNPHAKPNSDVVFPLLNAMDILRKASNRWIIDFGEKTLKEHALLYEEPWTHVEKEVKPLRLRNRRSARAKKYWIHGEVCPSLRLKISNLMRFIVSPKVAKHRIFIWVNNPIIPDARLTVFPFSDNYNFGILHSRLHEVWSLAQGSRLETRPCYTQATCFETFPFPRPTPAQKEAIAQAAKELDEMRNNWLHPEEWVMEEVMEFPGRVDGPWKRYVDKKTVNKNGMGTVRYPRIVPRNDACAQKLKVRTLTNLYNERPAWLDNLHKKLDKAVFDAYGWKSDLSEEAILEKLLALNLERAAEEEKGVAVAKALPEESTPKPGKPIRVYRTMRRKRTGAGVR